MRTIFGADCRRRASGATPQLEHEPDRRRRYHKGLDERLLRPVIRLESFGGDEMPSLIVDEALHEVGAEAVRIEHNKGEHERLLGGVFAGRKSARVRSYRSAAGR